MVIVYILIFLLVLAIVVCFHEFGHYIFAKKANILVNEFAFGMGPKLLTKKKGETYWSIRALPIGGFCAMSGEEATECPVKVGDEVKLVLDENGLVEKIIMKTDNPDYQNLPVIKVEKLDLFGENMSPLYINEYEVKRDCVLIFSKKEEMQIAPEERNFFSKTVGQRFLVCFGGPMNNIILAFFVFIILGFLMGTPDVDSNRVGSISENSPAQMNGIEVGDKIVKIGDYIIEDWNDVGLAIACTKSREVDLTVSRGEEEKEIKLYTQYYFQNLGFSSTTEDFSEDNILISCQSDSALGGKNGTKAHQEGGMQNGDVVKYIIYNNIKYEDLTWEKLLDLSLNTIDGGSVTVNYERDGELFTTIYSVYSNDLLESQGYEPAFKQIGIGSSTTFKIGPCFVNGLRYFWDSASIIFSTLRLLLFSKEVGLKDMGSFITILDQTASYASQGFLSLLYWVGLLSINLGIVNLLPIPALDGGRILFLIIEKITGKKINKKVETILINIAFWLLLALIGYITIQDILRLVAKFGAIL